MDLHIAICDDEQTEIQYLQTLVCRWVEERDITVRISTFENAESFLFAYEGEKSFDILLLDIQMKSINGVDLAKRIRKDNETVQIIFITGFPDFMAEGYEVSALNYLMKPVREEKLFEVLDKAQKSLNRKQKSILITSDGEVHRISIGQIMLCESFAHRTVITTKTKIYDVKLPISELESQLDDTFIRCHRSYIAAINHISRISKTDVLLDNGKKIPLSRRLYDEVNQAFIKYFKGDNHGTT